MSEYSERLIELHLQSSKGENVIVFLTAEDAQRVINDSKYAKHIANAALGGVTHVPSDTFQSQVASSNNITGNEEEEEMEADDELESTKEGGAKWNSAATLLLLHEYSEKENLFKSGKRAHRFYWEEIAKVMRSEGYTFSWGQISSKMDSLKRRYKKIKDAAKQSGNGRIPNWEFYDVKKKYLIHCKTYIIWKYLCTAGELVDVIYSKIKSDREEHYLKRLETKKKLHRLSEERKEIRHKEEMTMRAQFLQLLDARLKVIDAAAGTTMNYDMNVTQYLGPRDSSPYNQDSTTYD